MVNPTVAVADHHPPQPRKKKDDSLFLRPLKTKLRRYRTVAYDLESKDGDTQAMGMTRPFLGWIYDGREHFSFRQPPHLKNINWRQAPWLDDGGLIDQMMRHFLGLNLCGLCEVRNERALADPSCKLRLCDDCRENRNRYQSKHTRIYAHNAGRFDALFIVPWLLRHADRFEFEISGPESRVQKLDVWPRGQDRRRICWTFLDSVSILPMTLKSAGKTFCGVKEQKIDIDLDLDEDNLAWEAYNRRDCEVLYNSIEAVNTRVIALGGEVGVTTPSTAMSLFRHVFLEKPVRRNKHFSTCNGYKMEPDGSFAVGADGGPVECFACAHDFIRRGYYGGRTEMFAESGRDIRYYDVNSSYPFSMMAPMPVGKMIEVGDVQDRSFYEHLRKKKIGFVECVVFIPKDCEIPPLPQRLGGKLKFPKGFLKGVWDWDELMLLDHPRVKGKILRFIRSVWYEQRPIFRGMIDRLYGLRQAAKKAKDAGLDVLTKLLMNACYGKFGMRVDREALIVHRIGDPCPAEGRPIDGDPDESGVWAVPRLCDGPYVIPQIAAKVTSNSRILLFNGMMSVLDQGKVSLVSGESYIGKVREMAEGQFISMEVLEGASEKSEITVPWAMVESFKRGEVLYCDTDSIMCVNASVQPENEYVLGCWKREYPKILLDGTFVLPKLYQLRMHEPGCDYGTVDDPCPGCRWTFAFEDFVTGVKSEMFIDRRKPDNDFLDLGKRTTQDDLRFALKPPSIEKMKGVPGRMQDAAHFKQILPERRGGLGQRVYIDGSMITQHRTILRDRLEGPRVYRGVPGDPARLDQLSLQLLVGERGDELRKKIEEALASGDTARVERVADALDGAGYAVIATELRESEKYRARFRAVRTTYDKRTLIGDGRTKAVTCAIDESGEVYEVDDFMEG